MIKLTEKEREGYDILRTEMPDTLAMELVEYRRERKAKITARIARSLLEKYKQFGNIEQAITTQMERNWIGFEIDWLKRPSKFTEQHHPTPKSPFMQRQQSIKDQLVRDISGEIDEFTGQTFDLAAADYRAH
jgi:hypothetical protein